MRLAKKRAKNGLSEDTQEAQNSIDDVVSNENNAENNEFNNGAQDDEAFGVTPLDAKVDEDKENR